MSHPSRCNALQIRSVAVDDVDMALPLGRRAEYEMAAVGGPRRRIVHPRARGDSSPLLPVGADQAQLELMLGRPADVGDPIPARRPDGRGVVIPFERQSPNVGAVRAHDVNLWTAATIRGKGNFPPGRRPGG